MTDWSEKLRRCICWLIIILAGILPFVFCWLSDELFEFNKMMIVYLFASVIGCLCLARLVTSKRFIWQKSIFDLALALFLLSQIVATVFSLHPRTSLLGYYTRLNGGLLSTLAYLVIFYATATCFTRHDFRRLLQTLAVSSSLVSLYAILEHFGHSFSCYIIKGKFDVSCWVQDVQTRVYATLGQPNWLAAYNDTIIGLFTPAILVFWQKKSDSFLKFALPAATLLNFCSLLFTKSRSGILAFFAGLALTVIFFIITWLHRAPSTILQQVKLFAAIILFFLLPALIWGTQYTPSFSELFRSAAAQEETLDMGLPAHLSGLDVKITDSADIRKIVWAGAIEIWKHNFWIGTGVETFAYSYYGYRPQDHNWTSEWDYLYNKAHNELLNLAANTGIFGLATYISIFLVLGVAALFYLFKKTDNPNYLDHSYLLTGITAALLALSITNFFGFSTVTVQVLLFLYLALFARIFSDFTLPELPHVIDESWQRITFVTIAIFGFCLANQTWKTWYADYNYARCKSLITRSGSSGALEHCALAIKLRPREAMYRVDLANFYAQYAVAIAKQQPDQEAAITQTRDLALALSDSGLALNPYNLNFYKTRYQMFSALATIYPEALTLARADLEYALTLAPTDPKIAYYYSQILSQSGETDLAAAYLAKALELRPLYYDARLTAAAQAEAASNYSAALQHYRYLHAFIDADNTQVTDHIAHLATLSASLKED